MGETFVVLHDYDDTSSMYVGTYIVHTMAK